MRILQIIQRSQLRGAEIFTLQLSAHLEKSGHEVGVAVLYDTNHDLDHKINEFRTFYIGGRQSGKFMDITGWKNLANIIKAFNPDLIQANAGDTLFYSVLSKKIFNWKAKIIYRNANYISWFIDGFGKKILYKWLIKSVDHVVSVSDNCKNDLTSTLKYNPSKITSIPIGVENINPHNNNDDLKTMLGLNSTNKVVINVGSLVTEKNHFKLIDIFKKVLSKVENAKLLIAGDGKLSGDLKSYAQKLNLKDNVIFLGYRNDIYNLLTISDLMIMPSFVEGLPAVILEAMQKEVPVIASEVGGIPEVIINNQTGYCLPLNEEKLFVDSAVELLTNSTLKNKITGQAKELVENRFSNTIISNQFERVYSELL